MGGKGRWRGEGGGEGGDAGHSVIQRVVSPRSAAGRGFTAKREREKRTKAADTLKESKTLKKKERDVS